MDNIHTIRKQAVEQQLSEHGSLCSFHMDYQLRKWSLIYNNLTKNSSIFSDVSKDVYLPHCVIRRIPFCYD